jgi:hypothetical protein
MKSLHASSGAQFVKYLSERKVFQTNVEEKNETPILRQNTRANSYGSRDN